MTYYITWIMFVIALCANVHGVHRADRWKMFWECEKCHEVMGRIAYLLKDSPALKDREKFVKEFQTLILNDCDGDKLCCTEKDACAENMFEFGVEKDNGEFLVDTACQVVQSCYAPSPLDKCKNGTEPTTSALLPDDEILERFMNVTFG
ncbi:hypothetical protein DdX_13765 [Ditylenchus destructor]|uniref:Saposin B-type domain-containing protein n=1 Tax=Ditylenchus destructor TaxID=166010 RepID=A0AAD4MTU5_9BILA|nr:hypothetical protein DdX_13765 [Ditylenchus destructor]